MPETIKGIIFDIDGVLEFQGEAIPSAVEVIRTLRESGYVLRFLTNSTLKSRSSCAGRLRQLGFPVLDKEVFTASHIAAEYLRLLGPRSCWIMLEGEGLREFEGFIRDTKNPEYVVVGDNRSCFDFNHMNQALRLLLSGSKLIAMQSELVDFSSGPPELNVGSWVGMLERAAGVQALYLGKPASYNFRFVLQSMRLRDHQVLVVGDRISTDIVGAKRCGLGTVLVKTGEFRPLDLDGQVRPDYLIDGITGLVDIVRAR